MSAVTADSDISVSSIQIDPVSTLNAGSYTITLSSATKPIEFFPGGFIAGTSTVLLNGDADIEISGGCSATSHTFNNLVMGPITAPRTVSLGHSGCKAVITVNGTFISGTSATNTVSFVKGDAASDVTNPVTSYYCASNGGIANINCLPGGPPAPEINLKQSANIASGGTFDFGSVAVGSNSGAITFTIENTGSANLTLSGLPDKVGITGSTDFTVNQTLTTTPVAGAASTTFTVTFTPSSAAAKTASLSIANNDSDENPYTVTLNGTGTVAPTPGYGSNPAPGSTVNVGTATVGSPVSITLAVSETGNAALNVTSHALGGTNPGDFSVTPATLSIADGGAAQNLTIQCIPGAAGLRTATLTVNHNASGSPATYTLNCTGTGGATTTTTLPPAGGLPLAPSGLTAKSLSDTEILLSWTDNSSNESGFVIERFDGIKWETAGTVGANVTSFTDTGLRYTWQYYYRVIAYNASGSSSPGGGASAWTWMFPYEDCDGVALNGLAWYSEVNLPENSPPGTVIGTFTTINPTGTHRYEFYPYKPIPGIDNALFEIVGDTLRTAKNFTPDYETRQRYRISLRSVDVNANYAWCHAEFGIVITDVPEAPAPPPARSVRASLRIDSETADGTAAPGDTLRLSASVVNEGDTDVTGAVLTVPLPPGTEYAGYTKRSESDVVYNAELNQIVWTGDIPAGQTAEIAFDLKVAETAEAGDVIAPGEWSLACDTDGDGAADMTVTPEQSATGDETASPGVTVVVPDEPACLAGDVNGDGEITLADAVTVLQILIGTETDAPALCADADGDGKIGFAELFVVLRELAE